MKGVKSRFGPCGRICHVTIVYNIQLLSWSAFLFLFNREAGGGTNFSFVNHRPAHPLAQGLARVDLVECNRVFGLLSLFYALVDFSKHFRKGSQALFRVQGIVVRIVFRNKLPVVCYFMLPGPVLQQLGSGLRRHIARLFEEMVVAKQLLQLQLQLDILVFELEGEEGGRQNQDGRGDNNDQRPKANDGGKARRRGPRRLEWLCHPCVVTILSFNLVASHVQTKIIPRFARQRLVQECVMIIEYQTVAFLSVSGGQE